ncbi:hypothetical protein [Bifidobacterium gallicum]|nr:hypothetical protein [Bifidobacterium gallicum]KFI57676.1 hypothetical protein BGLCM_1366 [Bifidobacterium gallicum DSM 20093 = LMG 11596]
MAFATPTATDYENFRTLLAFFVKQADFNERMDHVDGPNSNDTVQADIDAAHAEFFKRYGISEDIIHYPNGLEYHILFGTDTFSEPEENVAQGTATTTEIDIPQTPIALTPSFDDNKQITAFTSQIVEEDQRTGDFKDIDPFTATVADLDLEGKGEPTEALKSLLDHQEKLFETWKANH